MTKGFTRNFKPFEVLEEGQIEGIWAGALSVLEETGLLFEVEEPKALKILDDGGCTVDYDARRVKFPSHLVEECLRQCPDSFRLEARDPENDLVVGGNRVYIRPGPGRQFLNLETFEGREPTRKEFYEAVTVYDALDNLHVFHSNSPCFSFQGVNPAMANIETYVARARNSTKVNWFAELFRNHMFIIEITRVLGARGHFSIGSASPLAWSDAAITALMAAVEAGIPASLGGGSVWGASAPATIAGEMITNLAEAAGPIVLVQLMDPGHPVMARDYTFPQNMRTGAPFFGNIANGLAAAVLNQCWRKYGIPSCNIEAAVPNSKMMDFQSAYEKGMNALAMAISGAHIVWLHGTVAGELTAHPIQAILDDDIAGMVGRFLQGVEVSDETLAVDLIKKVGPLPGHYLSTGHTREWWRREQFIPKAADLSTLSQWQKEGKKTCLDYARERMEEILATHKVARPLTPSQEEEIERILAEAREYHRKREEG